MRIQIASDLHLEQLPPIMLEAAPTLITPAPDADLLVLAGDIHNDVAGIDAFKDWPVPVLYVPGNHEFYDGDWPSALEHWRNVAKGTSVSIMDRDVVILDGVRFLCATLWTDFLVTTASSQQGSMLLAEQKIRDFFTIKTQKGLFRAEDSLKDHQHSRAWLLERLKEPFSGKTVVVTHHASHRLSIHPRFVGNELNGAFVSDLSELLFLSDLWIHGHVHDTFDYKVGKGRVVCNPSGYVRNRAAVMRGETPVMENQGFVKELVIEI